MDKYKKLEHITNALTAAGKIRLMYASHNNRQDAAFRPDNFCLLCDALKIIDSLYPARHMSSLGEIISKTVLYSTTYRNMKHHFRTIGSRRPDRTILLDTMKVVKPFLSSSYSRYVDKITKIHEILNS